MNSRSCQPAPFTPVDLQVSESGGGMGEVRISFQNFQSQGHTTSRGERVIILAFHLAEELHKELGHMIEKRCPQLNELYEDVG